MVDESLLREPADRGVRLVALSLLADARKAGDKLKEADIDRIYEEKTVAGEGSKHGR